LGGGRGRVEHVVSGDAAPFESVDDLYGFMRRALKSGPNRRSKLVAVRYLKGSVSTPKENRTMPIRIWIVILGIAAAAVSGCTELPSPAPATRPITDKQAQTVLACQRAITTSAAKFASIAMKKFGSCGQRAIALRVAEDRHLNSTTIDEFVARRAAVVASCNSTFAKVGKASTQFIDAIVAACQPVEDLILTDATRGDPLSFGAFASYMYMSSNGEIVLDTTLEIAGMVCNTEMNRIIELMGYQIPRTSDATRTFIGLNVDDFRDHLRTFLDSRCTGFE
jgi:hypothetical protein